MVRSSLRRGVAAVAVILVAAAGCASNDEDPPKAKPSPSAERADPGDLRGLRAPGGHRRLQAASLRTSPWEHNGGEGRRQGLPHARRRHGALQEGTGCGRPTGPLPDGPRRPRGLTEEKAVRRVDDLLAEREVDFGDGYTRNGLEAFSADAALQCMPDRRRADGRLLQPQADRARPDQRPGQQAGHPGGRLVAGPVAPGPRSSRVEPGVRGLYVAPELEQIAPFIWSGGGQVVDDTDEPTTLTLSDGPSRERHGEAARDRSQPDADLQREGAGPTAPRSSGSRTASSG